jgi:hypothetical protein
MMSGVTYARHGQSGPSQMAHQNHTGSQYSVVNSHINPPAPGLDKTNSSGSRSQGSTSAHANTSDQVMEDASDGA